MATNEVTLFFESFLKKRKDTMRMRWATYWFSLQNTTLLFYTKKKSNVPHLKGVYSIYTVQSVREVRRDEAKRFMFEIIMTNGKKKLLAAETAALRAQWQAHLLQAMYLCTSPGLCTQASSPCGGTAPSLAGDGDQSQNKTSFSPLPDSSAREPSSQEGCEHSNTVPWDAPFPHISSPTCEIPQNQTKENLYDVPRLYRRAGDPQERVKDVIYDVPSLLLRTKTLQTVGMASPAPS